jgi:hydroxyacylglutathione hydrolase
MFFQKIYTPGLAVNTYLLGDETTKECVVIDPTRHITPIIMAAEEAGMTIKAILETHVHADFVSGSHELKVQLKNFPKIYTSGFGGERWIPEYTDYIVKTEDILLFGSIRLKPLHTPGHTPEHIMWICYDDTRSHDLPWFILSGDCLFVGSVGRPDLLGKEEFIPLAQELYKSLFVRLAHLPDSVEIFPAHGAGSLCGKAIGGVETTTLGYERSCNPYLNPIEQTEWIKGIGQDLPAVPPYFSLMKKMNLTRPPLLKDLKVEKIHSLQELDIDHLFLLDVRHSEAFARFHILKSINIPLSPSFYLWAGWHVLRDRPIVIITDHEHHLNDIISQLRLMGFDQPLYTLILKDNCDLPPHYYDSIHDLTPEELERQLHESNESVFVLDVRTLPEWRSGHIADAYHVELNNLYSYMHKLPEDRLIAVICRSGVRASTAISLLKKYGFNHVVNVRGGMQLWCGLRLPMITADKE